MADVSRVFQGVQIEGERIAISVQPVDGWSRDSDPTLVLNVDARSVEWADWANMTADQVYKFTRSEIELARTDAGTDELRALHATYPDLPGFRSGFAVELEPGMHAELDAALPRVERVTRLNAALSQAVEPLLARSQTAYDWTTLHPHEVRALLCVAANVVLDGKAPADAIRYAVLTSDHRWAFSDDGDDPAYAELGVVLREVNVLAMLADAGKGRISSHE